MTNLAREFTKKYADTIICEPSGKTYTELIEDSVLKFKLIRNELKDVIKLKD